MVDQIEYLCAGCIDVVSEKSGLKCSLCYDTVYCSDRCQMSDWPKHQYICRKIEFEKKRGAVAMDLETDVIPQLQHRNISPVYIDITRKFSIPFYKVQNNKYRTVETRKDGIYLLTGGFDNIEMQKIFNILTMPMKPIGSRKYTKYSFYIKIYITLKYLPAAKLYASQNRIELYPNLKEYHAYYQRNNARVIKRLPNYEKVWENMNKLRNMSISLVNNLSKKRFIALVANKDTPNDALSKTWRAWYNRFVRLTSQKTIFVEKFVGLSKRALNFNAGEHIVITLRASVDPLHNLISVDALFLLLIHELAHTLAPSYTEGCSDCAFVIDPQRSDEKVWVDVPGEDSHGPRFQKAMIYLYREAYRLGMISFKREEYHEYELAMRKAYQDSSMLRAVDLDNL